MTRRGWFASWRARAGALPLRSLPGLHTTAQQPRVLRSGRSNRLLTLLCARCTPAPLQIDTMFDATCQRIREVAEANSLPLPDALRPTAVPGTKMYHVNMSGAAGLGG